MKFIVKRETAIGNKQICKPLLNNYKRQTTNHLRPPRACSDLPSRSRYGEARSFKRKHRLARRRGKLQTINHKPFHLTRQNLIEEIRRKKSFLCIGLDTDISKIPTHLGSDAGAMFEFNRAIIDATADLCVAYKINTAFYEALGSKGWEAMERTVAYIPKEHFKIADAKRGDIGNTSSQYAKAFFETLNFDAITVSPYMGGDSIRPFLEYENKWTIILALTSNSGSRDFEQLRIAGRDNTDEFLYERVLKESSEWGNPGNTMFVVGATKATDLERIRKIIPDHFLLIPGVGSQGGTIEEVSHYGITKECGLLVNISRAIIYASGTEDFADAARKKAMEYREKMIIAPASGV